MLALQASGHRIVNLACGMGRAADRERRQAEARESSRRTGFELIIPSRPVAIGSGDDLDAAQAELAELIAELVRSEAVDIVFSPSPHDRHPGHEVVGRAALDASGASRGHGAGLVDVGPVGGPALSDADRLLRPRAPSPDPACPGCACRRVGAKRLPPPGARPGGGQRRLGPRARVRPRGPGGPRGIRRAGHRGGLQGRGLASRQAEGAGPTPSPLPSPRASRSPPGSRNPASPSASVPRA